MTGHAIRDRSSLTIRSKIWIERDEEVVLSEWRVELLEAIDAYGSLTRAADVMQVPYRTAWDRVKAAEAQLGIRLLESARGGAQGGGSRLTPGARDYCQRFHRVSDGIQALIEQRFAVEFGADEA